MIEEATRQLSEQKDLPADLMNSVMEEIMTGRAQLEQIVSFLDTLSRKGETIEEIATAASVMRRHSTVIHIDREPLLDTCGTGADTKGTFNISTAAAFVASGCGVVVAKHGNRSVSSCCGSADILDALGININMAKEKLEECLNEIGIAFLFAPNLHPAMKFAMPARKQIASRTIFNILGPLTNPAGATHQLVGVYDNHLAGKVVAVLEKLGTKHALVVHSEDGLDEITTTGRSSVYEAHKGRINNYELDPQEFGFPKARLEDLRGGSIADNAKIMLGVLKGEPGPQRDVVLLNSAAAIYAADKVKSIKEGLNPARESIDSGNALKKLELLREYSSQAR